MKLPKLGDSISDATIIKLSKSKKYINNLILDVGDYVKTDEVIAEVETDKVNVNNLSLKIIYF
jgi:pyruvate/2-oxoglutarate dehydrogenase complex dihydrolipoamide acyltransferase (E2) component